MGMKLGRYLTVGEFANKLGVSSAAVRKWLRQNRLPYVVKFGGAWAIPDDAQRPTDLRLKAGGLYRGWRSRWQKRSPGF